MKIYRKVKKTVQIIFWAVFLVVVLVGIFSGWDVMGRWLAAIASGLAVLLYGGQKTQERINEKNQEIQEKEKELDQAAGDRQKRAETLTREDEDQQGQVEAWRERKERWKSRSGGAGGKLGGLLLVLCVLLVLGMIVAMPAWAGAEDRFANLTREELIEMIVEAEKLLDEADQRLARETVLKEEYRRLYLEAEEDLRVARELSRQKDETITGQRQESELLRYRLERSNQAWGITAGIDLVNSARWRVGVARKKGILSFAGGIGGGDRFYAWVSATLWLVNPL